MMTFIDKYIMPAAVKLGNNRHLLAIRDTLIGMIAITIIGSFAVLLNNLGQIIKPYGRMMEAIFGPTWTTLGNDISFGTFAFLTIFAVFGISYKLAKSYGDDGFEAMLISAACFFLLLPQMGLVSLTVDNKVVSGEAAGFISTNYFNATALFTGIAVSLIATEIFVRLSRLNFLVINMPEGVPPAVGRSFAKLIPGMATIFIIGVFGLLFRIMTNGQIVNDWLSKVIVSPMQGAVDSLPFAILLVFFVHILWMVGLHGPNILGGITTPLFESSGIKNIDLYAKGITDMDQYGVLAGSFLDAFVYLGGSGGTMGLIIAMIIAGRKRYKQMIGLGGAPGLFQINEPILFGLPIVLNPIWLVPFVLGPIITTVISYLAVSSGLVFPIVAKIPWVTPPIVGGFLATGGHASGAILAGINLVISTVIYLPFVYAQVKIDSRNSKAKTELTKDDSETVNF
ncbi:PTS sugar transporter subunit IIC [Peribacillus sp. NPDC097295]|uniref:PTS sugar transporter subunit IIC n=1 Tax=Peribacillus sp. NPDC097295 TaxID=3364402 RepID=UPI00380D5FA8